jgi:hypothetical protein
MRKGFLFNIRPEPAAYSGVGNVLVISIADYLGDYHEFQHNFELFVTQRRSQCRKFLVSIESPYRHSLLEAVVPNPFGVPTARTPED